MTVFIGTTGSGIARADTGRGAWQVEALLAGLDVRCLTADPQRQGLVWAGTQAAGILRSTDAGRTWKSAGLDGLCVKSICCAGGRVFAGTKPPAVFVTEDGQRWSELTGFHRVRRFFWMSPAERPFTPYVLGLAADGDVVVAGIEFGALVRSADGGRTWVGHRRGSLRDCHSLATARGGWFFEAGGTGGGAAFSTDGGDRWQRPSGHDRHYGWACTVDPTDPEVWYFSAAPGVRAHSADADAAIYRCRGGGRSERLGGGLPEPMRGMPYGLVAGPEPGRVTAALSDGEVWQSTDRGQSWSLLGRLPRVERSFITVDL